MLAEPPTRLAHRGGGAGHGAGPHETGLHHRAGYGRDGGAHAAAIQGHARVVAVERRGVDQGQHRGVIDCRGIAGRRERVGGVERVGRGHEDRRAVQGVRAHYWVARMERVEELGAGRAEQSGENEIHWSCVVVCGGGDEGS